MNALIIARKDIQVFLKDRGAVVYLFLLPVLFILLFAGLGAAARGSGASSDSRVTLPVVNLDPEGEAAKAFLAALDQAGGVQVKLYGEGEAQALLREAKIARVLTIPAGFSAATAAGFPVKLMLSDHPNADKRETEAVLRVMTGVARDMELESQIMASLQQMADMQAAQPETARFFTAERLIAQAKSQFESSKTRPLVAVAQLKPQAVRASEESRLKFDFVQASVPAYAVLFVFLAAQTTAQSIREEKKAGSFRRLLAAPVSKGSLLLGKLLPNLATTLLQIVIMFAVGLLLLPLLGWGRLNLGNDRLALVLVSLLIALCSTSLGVFIAAIARTEGQVGGLSMAILWIAAVLGGSLLPSFMLPQAVNAIGRLLPHYWANQAYYDLIARGQTLAGVTTPIVALLAFTIAFLAVGLWRFDFDQ